MNEHEKILTMLEQDARLTPEQLADMAQMDLADVKAILRDLEKNNTILGYKTVIDWDKTEREQVTALIEVKITPQKGMGFDEIARQIYSHHQVESVYLMSGGFDLTVIISGRTMREVARFVSEQLADMAQMDLADVKAILRDLEKNNTILGYKTVIDWDKTEREQVTALIEVKITPQKGMGFDEIARQIYSHHQVESVYLMSGGFDLTVIISGRTMREVARFVSEQLAPMENVLSTGTHFILKKYKEQGVTFDPSEVDSREVMM